MVAQDIVLVTGGFGLIRLWKNKYSLSRDHVATNEEKMAQEAQTNPDELLEQAKKYELAYNGNATDGTVLVGQSIRIINSVERIPDIINDIMKTIEKNIRNLSASVT